MTTSLEDHSRGLVAAVSAITAASPDSESLRYAIEQALERICRALGIAWTACQLDRATGARGRFAEVVHGAVVIEYEQPSGFAGGHATSTIRHAKERAEVHVGLICKAEGRPRQEYLCLIWDGAHTCFGRHDGDTARWEPLTPFDQHAAQRLLTSLRENGAPLVHPQLLTHLVGPDSPLGTSLLPKLYRAVRQATAPGAPTTKTSLLFTEWRRLFGQVAGVRSGSLTELLARQGAAHNERYDDDVPAYLYALNTQIALVAKLVAALALPDPGHSIADPATTISARIDLLESGRLFSDAGIANMLAGDFFAWYREDAAWPSYAADIDCLVATLRTINFDVSRKTTDSTRDLFKGLYMSFVPRPLRHALGEYYTPDWLAAHVLDQIGWDPGAGLLDPTAGSGTFLIEALRRRLSRNPATPAHELLAGLYGIDLNPLAVLTARASLVVYLAGRFDPARPLRLPVFLADAINPARADGRSYEHRIQTELGARTFRMPAAVVESDRVFALFARIREMVDAGARPASIVASLRQEFSLGGLDADDVAHLRQTVDILVDLHARGWNGIWCSLLADRFAAGTIPPGRYVIGNPPWVKWSHLPVEYAEFIKDRCLELGVFSVDRWVGGIESDISTIITYQAVDKYLTDGGTLAFLMTGTVFANESSQGFRRWHLRPVGTHMKVELAEDFAAVAPFEGVANHATLLVLTRGIPNEYPVTYRVWRPLARQSRSRPRARSFPDAAAFREQCRATDLEAYPVPGSDAGPWLRGTAAQHAVWAHLFGRQTPAYRARKGVTTDANGVFFVRPRASRAPGLVRVSNDPLLGRRRDVDEVSRLVEEKHVFPLLRGVGVAAFRAAPDPTYRILVPQRSMHGDPDLPQTAPRTLRYFKSFKGVLESRSSYQRFQKRQGAPYWSLWSMGEYTFSAYKVVWRELSGGRFAAAYIGRHSDPVLGERIVIPDHKLYFVSCVDESEAAFLTGLLNAPIVAAAISAYAAQLSLGASVVEYLLVPPHDGTDPLHHDIAEIAMRITAAGGVASAEQMAELDRVAAAVLAIPKEIAES